MSEETTLGLWQDAEGLGTAASDELLENEVLPLLLCEIPRIWKESMKLD